MAFPSDGHCPPRPGPPSPHFSEATEAPASPLPQKESRSQTSLLLLAIHSQVTHSRGKAETSPRALKALLVLALSGSESGQISPLPCSLLAASGIFPLLSSLPSSLTSWGAPASQRRLTSLSGSSLAAASSFSLQRLVPSFHSLPTSFSNTCCTVLSIS